MREVRVAVAPRMVLDLSRPVEYNVFEVPETLEEAVRDAEVQIATCECQRLPCSRCATIGILLRAVDCLRGDQ